MSKVGMGYIQSRSITGVRYRQLAVAITVSDHPRSDAHHQDRCGGNDNTGRGAVIAK